MYNGNSYKLYKIDLNAYDLTKLEETKRNADSLFYEGTRKPVLEYTNEDVKNQPFVYMHCRGSSDKQPVDFDEKLLVLFLHDCEMYIWVDDRQAP